MPENVGTNGEWGGENETPQGVLQLSSVIGRSAGVEKGDEDGIKCGG